MVPESVAALQLSWIELLLSALAARPAGTLGGVVSETTTEDDDELAALLEELATLLVELAALLEALATLLAELAALEALTALLLELATLEALAALLADEDAMPTELDDTAALAELDAPLSLPPPHAAVNSAMSDRLIVA